jgi:hypothetical protein
MSKVTDWEIVWCDKRTGRQRKTLRRSEAQARIYCRMKIDAAHTDVRYRGIGHKRWRTV